MSRVPHPSLPGWGNFNAAQAGQIIVAVGAILGVGGVVDLQVLQRPRAPIGGKAECWVKWKIESGRFRDDVLYDSLL